MSDTCTRSPPVRSRSVSAPRWYFTSPVSLAALAAYFPSNSSNTALTGLSSTCVSTLMRPRCAIAITTSRAPAAAAPSIAASSIGTSVSFPSIEKRL